MTRLPSMEPNSTWMGGVFLSPEGRGSRELSSSEEMGARFKLLLLLLLLSLSGRRPREYRRPEFPSGEWPYDSPPCRGSHGLRVDHPLPATSAACF